MDTVLAAARTLTAKAMLGGMLLAQPLAARDRNPAPVGEDVLFQYHAVVPLGAMVFTLKPANQSFYLLASAMGREFDGWKIVGSERNKRLLDASGAPVKKFPRRIEFRVSACERTYELIDIPKDPLPSPYTLSDFLVGLHFRAKLYDGLHSRVLEPAEVRMIGMPASVPYDERIYQVSFNLADVPSSERLVLEVLSPAGDRVAKFHLDLY